MDQKVAKLKPGDSVWVRLKSPEPGGYLVTLTPNGNDIDGFLPSHDPIDIGRVVPTTFVCMNGDRALLTYAFVLGTTARVQVSTASDEENAFSVWADSYPNGIRLRRAVDLVMPPISATPIVLALAKGTTSEFFGKLETAEFTGCIKLFCQERLSRAALIFLQGRVVGSVYSTKTSAETYPFVGGLKKLSEDLALADADLEMYDLPPDLIISMSALFLGYLDHSNEQLTNAEYTEKMLGHFANDNTTACFSLVEESLAPCGLGFVYEGAYKGTYAITERIFAEDRSSLAKFLATRPDAKLRAYILPAAMMTGAVRFGYSMTSEQFAHDEGKPSAI